MEEKIMVFERILLRVISNVYNFSILFSHTSIYKTLGTILNLVPKKLKKKNIKSRSESRTILPR